MSLEAGLADTLHIDNGAFGGAGDDQTVFALGAMARFDVGCNFGRFRLGGVARFVFRHQITPDPIDSVTTNSYETAFGPSVDVRLTSWLRIGAAALFGVNLYRKAEDDGTRPIQTDPYAAAELSLIFDLPHSRGAGVPYMRLSGSAGTLFDGGLTFGYRL